jgi:hypothetical protein
MPERHDSPVPAENLTPSALLKRLHDIERAAATRERRDAALVARLQREVNDLEEKLLDAYTASASVDVETGSSGPHVGADAVSLSPNGSISHSMRRASFSPQDRAKGHHDVDADDDANDELQAYAEAPAHDRERALLRRESRLAADREAFHAQVTLLEEQLAAWETQLKDREAALRSERAALATEKKEMRADFAAERAELSKQKQHIAKLESECRGVVATVGATKRKEASRKVAPPPATALACSGANGQPSSTPAAVARGSRPAAREKPGSRSGSAGAKSQLHRSAADRTSKSRSVSAHAPSRGRSPSPQPPARAPASASAGPSKTASPEGTAVSALNAEIADCDRVLRDAHTRKVTAQAQRTFLVKRSMPSS